MVVKFYKSFDGKTFQVKQAGEQLTPAEESALRNKIGGDFIESTKRAETLKKEADQPLSVFTRTGRFRGADYKTGVGNTATITEDPIGYIQGKRLRTFFGQTDNFDEKVAYLNKMTGDKGYVVDKLGNFLLTPEGQKTLGIKSTNNLLAIDSDKFEAEDFLDFLGEYGYTTGGSIAGFAGGLALGAAAIATLPVSAPIAGLATIGLAVAGSGAGAYAGNALNEAQQWMRGIQKESAAEVNRRGLKEAAWAAGGDLATLGLLKGVGRILKASPKKQAKVIYGEDAYKDWSKGVSKGVEPTPAKDSYKDFVSRGYRPNPYSEPFYNKNLRARMGRIAEQIAGLQTRRSEINAKALRKEFEEALTPEEYAKITDKDIVESMQDALGLKANELRDASKGFRHNVVTNVAGILDNTLKGLEKGTIKLDEDAGVIFKTLQDNVAIGSTEAITVGERAARKGFEKIMPLFDEITPQDLQKQASKFFDFVGPNKMPVMKRGLTPTDKLLATYLNNTLKSTANENINVISAQVGKRKVPVFAMMFDEEKGIRYISPDSLLTEIQKFKKTTPLRNVGEGTFAKLYNTEGEFINNKFMADQQILLSPLQVNEVIQEMRKITLAANDGINFPVKNLWDSAVQDFDVANAALASAVDLAKKGKVITKKEPDIVTPGTPAKITRGGKRIEAVPAKRKIGKTYKPKDYTDGLNLLDDYVAKTLDITIDNRKAFEAFEEFGLGVASQKVAEGKMPIENLFKYVLKEQADSPQVVESFIDYTGDVIRRGDRSMLKTSPETAALGQDEIIKDVIEQPISLAKGQQKIAQDVLEETVDVSKTAQTEVTKGRTSLRKQDEILLNKLAQANPKELKQGIKQQFGKEIVKEMGVNQGQTTIRQVSDVIAKYGYNGQGTADSTLQVIFGKDGAKELLDLKEYLDTITDSAMRAGDFEVGTEQAIKSLFDQNLKFLADPNTSGTASLKEVRDNVKLFNKNMEEQVALTSDAFFNTIKQNGFKLENGDVDIDKFVTQFLNPTTSTQNVERVLKNLTKNEKANLQQRILERSLTRALGKNKDEVDEIINSRDLNNALSGGFVKQFGDDPKRFNMLFGESKFKNPYKVIQGLGNTFDKVRKWEIGNNGALIAQTLAAAFAALPVGILTGNIPLAAGAGLATQYQTIKAYANMLNSEWFLKALADPRWATKTNPADYFNPNKANLSELLTMYNVGLANTARNMIREQGDEPEEYSAMSNQKTTDRLKRIAKPKSLFIPSRENISDRISDLGGVLSETITAIPGAVRSSTPLPKVQDFRQDVDVFSELNRRKALAGNNPDTQAIAEKGQR